MGNDSLIKGVAKTGQPSEKKKKKKKKKTDHCLIPYRKINSKERLSTWI